MGELTTSLNTARASLQEAQNDLNQLQNLSNQFRTCFVMVNAPPSGTYIPTADGHEIKDSLEVQRSRFEGCTLEDAISWIDTCQTHLALFSRLARELSKTKIKVEVETDLLKLKENTENLRAKKSAKINGKIHIDAQGDEIKNPVTAGIDPIDKMVFKGIKKIQRTLGCDFATARDMVLKLQIKKEN